MNTPFDAFNQSNNSMVGIGTTPEGINQNAVMYDLLNDHSFMEKP